MSEGDLEDGVELVKGAEEVLTFWKASGLAEVRRNGKEGKGA